MKRPRNQPVSVRPAPCPVEVRSAETDASVHEALVQMWTDVLIADFRAKSALTVASPSGHDRV